MLLGLFTLAKPSAILDLTWDRIDFDKGLIDLNPKVQLNLRPLSCKTTKPTEF